MFVIRSFFEHLVSSALLLIRCSASQAEVTSPVPSLFSFADSEKARPALGRCQRRRGKKPVYRCNRWTQQAGRHADLPLSTLSHQPVSFIVNYGQFWGKPSRVHWYINSLLFMRSIKYRGFFFSPLPPQTTFEVLVRCCNFFTCLLLGFWSCE